MNKPSLSLSMLATLAAFTALAALATASVPAAAQSVHPQALDAYTAAERAIPIFNEAHNTLPPLKIPLDPPAVNLQSRDEVLAYYHGAFGMMAKWWANWSNGNLDTCVRGTTSRGFQESVVARANWWRGMAGRPTNLSFKLDAEQSRLAQEGAMMLNAAHVFMHDPAPTIKCYSRDGDIGADGNLDGNNDPDASATDGMIQDGGDTNVDAGHRAGTLYIDQRIHGVGSTGTGPVGGILASNATKQSLKIFNNIGIPLPAPVAFPAAGFTLLNVLPNTGRWEYMDPRYMSSARATVTMTKNGAPLPVTVGYRTGQEEYNYPRLVWDLPLLEARNAYTQLNSGEADVVYTVTVSGLTKYDGTVAPDVHYTVTAINGFPGHADWNGDQNAQAVSEFYVPAKDTYFLSQSRDDALLIDDAGSGTLYRSWRGFYAWPNAGVAPQGAVPVCRWFFKAPQSTHFYSGRQSDCDLLRQTFKDNAAVAVEDDAAAFYIMLPKADGSCDAKYQPVYRLFNNRGAQNEANHRYTVHPSDRQALIARNWTDEGIAFCAPRKKENYLTDGGVMDWKWY